MRLCAIISSVERPRARDLRVFHTRRGAAACVFAASTPKRLHDRNARCDCGNSMAACVAAQAQNESYHAPRMNRCSVFLHRCIKKCIDNEIL
jgi:hypothetical protein